MRTTCLLFICLATSFAHAQAPQAKPIFDGKSLAGWQVAEKHSYEKSGKVQVKDGVILMEKGRIATGIVYAKKDFPRTDYEVTLEARRTDGNDFFCGITFPVGKSYCSLILGGWGGDTTGLSNVDGMAAAENDTARYIEFEKNRWYNIRLRVAEDTIQAWVDKERIVNQPIKNHTFNIWWEQEPLRHFGIGNWYTSSELRNISLQRLAKDQKKTPK